MKFKALLDRWKEEPARRKTAEAYSLHLNVDDAARLHALKDLFPSHSVDQLIGDLLHAALEELSAAMPYEPGPKVISRDEQGDPVYEDVGLTPRFAELTRRYKKTLETKTGGSP